MLETDIKAVYERMAAADQPPTHISIPAAHRHGRAQLRRRRATAIGAPVLAAGAVAAIAFTGALTAGNGLVPATGTRTAPAVAPKYFDPLRPYVSFGWLPAGWPNRPVGTFTRTTASLTAEISGLNVRPDPQWVSVEANANGRCHVSGHTLNCGKDEMAVRLGRKVGTADGRPAYWTKPPSEKVSLAAVEGTLAWQYARGGWATVQAPSLIGALNVAATVQFGRWAQHSTIRFSAQLTGVPADWQVNWVNTAYMRNSPGSGPYLEFASAYGITAGPGPAAVNLQPYGPFPAISNTPSIVGGPFVGRGACALGYSHTLVTRVINGYEVYLETVQVTHEPTYSLACAADADGALVDIAVGPHPVISAENLFAHHIRLFGPRPDKWTTKPVG
jgi:hypothetical protein